MFSLSRLKLKLILTTTKQSHLSNLNEPHFQALCDEILIHFGLKTDLHQTIRLNQLRTHNVIDDKEKLHIYHEINYEFF